MKRRRSGSPERCVHAALWMELAERDEKTMRQTEREAANLAGQSVIQMDWWLSRRDTCFMMRGQKVRTDTWSRDAGHYTHCDAFIYDWWTASCDITLMSTQTEEWKVSQIGSFFKGPQSGRQQLGLAIRERCGATLPQYIHATLIFQNCFFFSLWIYRSGQLVP